MAQTKCKHCKDDIEEINFALGKKWMHIVRAAGFPSQMAGTMWEYCKLQFVAAPEDEKDEQTVKQENGGW